MQIKKLLCWYGLDSLCVGLLDEELSSTSHCTGLCWCSWWIGGRSTLECNSHLKKSLTWVTMPSILSKLSYLSWRFLTEKKIKISDLRQNVFTFATISLAAVFTSSFSGLTWYLDCKYGIWLGGKWPNLVKMLNFFDHPKIVRHDACIARSDCNVTLTEKYENPSTGSREFPWKRVLYMGKTLFGGMGVKRRRKRHYNDMNWSTGKHLEARGSILKLMERRE